MEFLFHIVLSSHLCKLFDLLNFQDFVKSGIFSLFCVSPQFFSIKKTHRSESFKELLQARLELALGYTPNWILSPTRLPIPPLEHAFVYVSFAITLPYLSSKDYQSFSSAECHWNINNIQFSNSQLLRNLLFGTLKYAPSLLLYYIKHI